MPIVLVGMMGTGKSTVAKLVAQLLSVSVLDTDLVIEKEAGMPVSDIFKIHSESYFRALESEVLKRVLPKSKLVLSTGGGIVLAEHNRNYLKEIGLVVWLHASVETILERVKDDGSRPLLGKAPSKETLRTLCETREGYYKDVARLRVDVDGKTPFQIADQIISYYNRSK